LRKAAAVIMMAKVLAGHVMNLRAPRIWSSNKSRLVTLLTLLGILCSGCVTARYRPMVEMQGHTADATLRLVEMRMAPAPEFIYRTHSSVRRVIRRGWLTEGTRAPCTDGVKVEQVLVDGEAVVQPVIPPGDHELRVQFQPLRRSLELDLVLDLLTEDGTCLRAPAVIQSIPFVTEKRLAITVGLPVEAHGNLSGMNGYVGGTVGAGGWVGPALVTATAGLGGAMCNSSVCKKSSDGKARHGAALPLAALAQYYPTIKRSEGILLAPFIGARYSYVTAWLPADDGDRRVGLHGVHALFGWGLGDGHPGPFRNMERTQLLELGIPVGVWIDPTASSKHVVFGSGFELRVRLTF
jgi:hypothetical protein